MPLFLLGAKAPCVVTPRVITPQTCTRFVLTSVGRASKEPSPKEPFGIGLIGIGAVVANLLDHLEIALYLFLAPVIIRDLFTPETPHGWSQWSLGLPLSGALRILLALGWNSLHQKFGSLKILRLSLLGVSLCCLGLGGLGLIAQWLHTHEPKTGYLLAIALVCSGLRALQGFFSMAETHAARSVMMAAPASKQWLANILSNASSIGGTLAASLLCWSISLWDRSLDYWPCIYLIAGLLTIVLALWRRMRLFPMIEENRASLTSLPKERHALDRFRAVQAMAAACVGYSTFYWVSILILSQKKLSMGSFLESQTQVMGLDLLLLLILGYCTRFIGAWRQMLISSALCAMVAIGYMTGLISATASRWLILLFGVGCASCYSSWIAELSRPYPLFPYSCTGAAIGSTAAGFALTFSLWLREAGYSCEASALPFTLIFLTQPVLLLLWKRQKTDPTPME